MLQALSDTQQVLPVEQLLALKEPAKTPRGWHGEAVGLRAQPAAA